VCVCVFDCSGHIKKGDRILSMREISDPDPLPGGESATYTSTNTRDKLAVL
jgi:hypothetical protein